MTSDDATGGILPGFRTLDEQIEAAEVAGKEGDFAKALVILRGAVERHPDDARARYALGLAIFLSFKADITHQEIWEPLSDDEELAEEAEAELEQAIELNPKMAEAYATLGILKGLRGENRAAVEILEKALELEPGIFSVRENLEIIKSRLDEDEAE